MNILLDYFFPISSVEPTPAASTAFLKQVCVVAKPKSPAVAGTLQLCTTMSQVLAITDNTEAQQLFNAGMSRVYILLANDLDLSTYLEGHESDFYTLLISSDFDDADIAPSQASGVVTISSFANLVATTGDVITVAGQAFTAQAGAVTPGDPTFQGATSNDVAAASLAAQINAHTATKNKVIATVVGAVVTIKSKDSGSSGNLITLTYTDNGSPTVGATLSGITGGHFIGGDGLFTGLFTGVVGIASEDDAVNAANAATPNYVGFHTSGSVGAKNLFFAFGKLLSNALNWTNQQYITMPFADDVDTLGEANALFDDKISFVLDDSQFGKRLGLFAQGASAITAPYIKRNLQIDMQSKALTFISGNQPTYTNTNAALLEDELQKVVQSYIDRQWIDAGTVTVKLEQSDFVASGYINISKPNALWRIFGQMQQTL